MESDSKSDRNSGGIEVADIVLNLNGRDKGKIYFVVGVQSDYVQIADGNTRKIEKPKRKKMRHVKLTARNMSRTAVMLRSGEKVANAELRRALNEFTATLASEEVYKLAQR